MADKTVIAVPVESGDGLDARRSAHFGHAAGFAIVELDGESPGAVRVVQNPPHEHAGCMVTVNLLAAEGVTAVSAAGMGRGPLAGLRSVGIAVYHDAESSTVGEAIDSIVSGRAVPFADDHSCRGHHH